ncbi:uncharacterized protein IL334_000686 [Kwoniella shivajii]|uniref:Uncharacterized protein n=1 Tax=Kwoniella shivajii TaxID=564305 RepID=A0ABZ1CPU4_9TREE|nr:hypothetical protein IL334_000686 [Kwoniella shivajii]
MVSARASSSAPPKVKSTKTPKIHKIKSSKDKAPQAISPEEVPSDVDSDNIDEPIRNHDEENDDASSSSSSSEVDSEDNIENVTSKRSQARVVANGKGGKSLKKYQPPIGMSELKVATTFQTSPFEWNSLANKQGVELWAIRVPKDFKASRLSSLSLSVPSSSSTPITGNLKTKSTNYTLSTAGTSSHSHTPINEEGRQPVAGPGVDAVESMKMDDEKLKVEGGEEMDGLRLMVPQITKGGKLFVAPKPITRKLILTPSISTSSTPNEEQTSIPSFLSTSTSTTLPTSAQDQVPTKRSQPTHLLKFRNFTYGFSTPGPETTISHGMDIDGDDNNDRDIAEPNSDVKVNTALLESATKEKKDKKEKKRKGESTDSPKKKSKKSKD